MRQHVAKKPTYKDNFETTHNGEKKGIRVGEVRGGVSRRERHAGKLRLRMEVRVRRT